MAARDPFLEKLGEIPDPAARTAEDPPAPEAAPPEGPSMTRAGRRSLATFAVVVVLAWIAFVLMNRGLRRDLASTAVAVPLALWIAASVLALVFVFRRDPRGMPPSARVAQVAAFGLPLLFLVIAAAAPGDSTPFTWRVAAPCLVWSSIAGAVPAVVAALLLGRSFLSAPISRGAAVGAVCGLGATITIHAHCSSTSSAHVLIAHGFPVVIGAILGAVLGAVRGRA